MGAPVRPATGFIEGRHCQYPLARIESLPAAQPVPADEVNRLFSTTRPDVPVDEAPLVVRWAAAR